MRAAGVIGCREVGRRARAGSAVAIALLCAGTWAPPARAETPAGDVPRGELFLAAGATVASPPTALHQTPGGATFNAGGAICVNRSVAVGVSTGWYSIGTYEQVYFRPANDFSGAKQSFALVPVIGYVKARLPMGSHGGVPYLMAGAGPYTLLKKTYAAGAQRVSDTRVGFCAALGLADRAGTWSPQFELRFDARPMEQETFGLVWPHSQLQTITASVGLQFP